jgi:hypothetical protein
LGDGARLAADLDVLDAVVRPDVGEARQRHDFVIGGHASEERGVGPAGPAVQDGLGVRGKQPDPVADIGQRLICIVHHCVAPADLPKT